MLNELFFATLSQTLQAFLPVGVALAWLARLADRRTAAGLKWGIVASLPVTIVATALFRTTSHQARTEAFLALGALCIAVYFVVAAWNDRAPDAQARVSDRQTPRTIGAAVAATLLIVRQTMEIGVVVYAAVYEVRAAGPTMTVAIGVLTGVAACLLLNRAIRSANAEPARTAFRIFSILFVGQVFVYGFHEASEAGLLPWSATLHAATEPYGPDSTLAIFVSSALVVLPLGAIAYARMRETIADTVTATAIGACAVGLVAAIVMVFSGSAESTAKTAAPDAAAVAPAGDPAVLSSAPHVLFRNMRRGDDYGKLGIAALASPDTVRAIVDLPCARVSFAGDNGICLQAESGSSTKFRAVLFDQLFGANGGFELAGSPSRTRVSPDGRVGTTTVFITGQTHGYSSASFSTKTTLVDMTSRRVLVDSLEEFSTWRDGKRFAAPDFNFWGVTFTHDSNAFFASLRTDGQTYLVRGDIAQRRFTVLRENVECPSLSPDNHLIAFKKRVGPQAKAWRIYILDLETMTERPLAQEGRSVDDQIEWVDNTRVLYALSRMGGTADIWDAPIDGSGPARIFMHDAESPIVLRAPARKPVVTTN
jgi:hypothetical protein